MELDEIQGMPPSADRLREYAALAASADDPVLAVRAKLGEIETARRLERQTHAVVAGTELLALVEALPPGIEPVPRLSHGFHGAIAAALDLPEIPLETVDQLLAVMERVVRGIGKQPYVVWQLEARRHHIAGDLDAVRERVERLVPNVSRENHWRHDWECPGCCLCAFASWLELGAEPPEPDAVYSVLEPILSGRPVRWNEDPALLPALDRWYGGRACCDASYEEAHVQYARALCRAGRVAAAQAELGVARRYRKGGAGVRFLARIAEAEVAVAAGDEPEIRRTAESVLEALEGREDINEAWLLGVAAVRALRALADPRAERVLAGAYEHARRLDARIPRPRHVAELDRLFGA